MTEKETNKAKFILSTDTLSGYGLDFVFQIAKDVNFDGIDLAMWKNFDAWNVPYVKSLIDKYSMPVHVIQVSANTSIKEMNQAVSLAKDVGASVISINSPSFFNLRTIAFLKNNLTAYRKYNPNLKFAIINPAPSNILFVPKYYFSNLREIIKYNAYLGLDIANIEENLLESIFLKKMSNYIPHIGVVYLSDKTKTGIGHVPLGEGSLKLPSILKKFKQNEYYGAFSLKLTLSQKDLGDVEKIQQIFKKCRLHYKENFADLTIK